MSKKLSFQDIMVFFILSSAVALGYQIPYLKFTFYDQMMAALQINNTQMGFLSSVLGFTNMVCYPIGGILADRFSTRSLITITFAALAAVSVWFAFTTNYILLIIIHVLFGFFTIATLWSAYLSGIRNLGGAEIQGKLFGFSESTRGIVQTLAGFLFVAVMGTAASAALGFRYVLLTGAAISAVFAILSFIFLPKENKKKAESEKDIDDGERYTIIDVLKNKGVWITTFLITCAFVSWALGNTYLTTYTVQVLNISPDLASTLGVIRSYVIVLLAGFFGGYILDKFTYKGKAFMLLLAINAIIIAAIMLTSKMIAVCVALTLVVAFVINIMKSTYWSTMDQAGIPAKMTPLATGVMSFICFLPGDVLLQPICGKWIDAAAAAGNVAMGFNKIFIMLIIFSLVGIFASYLLMKHTKSLKKNTVNEKASIA